LAKAVAKAANPVSGIAGIAPCSESAIATGNPARADGERERVLLKPLRSSPAQWSASAALPPLPQRISLPPPAIASRNIRKLASI
jgi:hypothetical protein